MPLGAMYAKSRGVSGDYAAATVKWYRKASEEGFAGAQFRLAWMYDYGEVLPENDAEAVEWYRKASKQGHTQAQADLGWMCANGLGVPENDVEAYAWYNVAAAAGDDGARKRRDSIRGDLAPSEIVRGQAMAKKIFEQIRK